MANEAIERFYHCTDETLLALISQKDVAAYEIFYDRHASPVFKLILKITRDAERAEELVQDTFWQVWQKANQFEGKGSAAAWLACIARNKALDYLRRQRSRSKGADELWNDEQLTPFHGQTTEHVIEQQLTQQHVASALNQLPSAQRICLELAYFEGMSQTEIAAYTHLPLGTIKTRLRCGRDKVERMLRAIGYSEILPLFAPEY